MQMTDLVVFRWKDRSFLELGIESRKTNDSNSQKVKSFLLLCNKNIFLSEFWKAGVPFNANAKFSKVLTFVDLFYKAYLKYCLRDHDLAVCMFWIVQMNCYSWFGNHIHAYHARV